MFFLYLQATCKLWHPRTVFLISSIGLISQLKYTLFFPVKYILGFRLLLAVLFLPFAVSNFFLTGGENDLLQNTYLFITEIQGEDGERCICLAELIRK